MEILRIGKPLKDQVELLITIRRITPLTALAFVAHVGDVHRSKTLRNMNAYLGLVPRLRASGDKSWSGHINRASRKLTWTILMQSLIQVTDASLYFRNYYEEMESRRGAGRSRITLIRKLCGIMRRMLLDRKPLKYAAVTLYPRKQKQYEKRINQIRDDRERKSA
jgi:hypothetical protein